jgi:predicted glycosyltransferase
VPDFKPNGDIHHELGIDEHEQIVTVRPPATEAHYHNPESERLFEAAINYLAGMDNIRVVVLPRNEKQAAYVKKAWDEWCSNRKIIIPDHVVDGLDLIWSSDLVISGGGTMNREAAALGVPVYSIFRGKLGAVDKYLSDTGRLTLLTCVEDVRTKLVLNRREKSTKLSGNNNRTLNCIVDDIVKLIETPKVRA